MEEAAYIVELLAGLFYICAAIPLLRRAKESGQIAERLLGITFLLFGTSYIFYETPYLLKNDALLPPFTFIGRALYAASVVTTGVFTRHVFHHEKAWAARLLYLIFVLLLVGFVVSAVHGDWEGEAPLSNPGFWFEWVGQFTPCAWVAIAGFAQYFKARRRARLGLSDHLVCNRFLLFGLFGLMQALSVAVLIPMYVEYERHGTFSETIDSLLGSIEMLTIVFIWFAFFPPAAYRRWIMGDQAAPAAERS